MRELKTAKIRLVPVDPDDPFHVLHLYNLLSERTPKQSISHKEMPTYAQHEAFVKSKPYAAWYLVMAKKFTLGAVYITHASELGLFLFNYFQGGGFGTRVIETILNKFPNANFYANIAPRNIASQKFFEKLGFKPIQYTYRRTPQNDE